MEPWTVSIEGSSKETRAAPSLWAQLFWTHWRIIWPCKRVSTRYLTKEVLIRQSRRPWHWSAPISTFWSIMRQMSSRRMINSLSRHHRSPTWQWRWGMSKTVLARNATILLKPRYLMYQWTRWGGVSSWACRTLLSLLIGCGTSLSIIPWPALDRCQWSARGGLGSQ